MFEGRQLLVKFGVACAIALGLSSCGDEQAAPAAAVPSATTAAAVQRPEGAGDYYDPAVDVKADALVAAVSKAATTPATLKARARDLWTWANAAAVSGMALDPDLPAAMGRIAALPDAVPQSATGVGELCARVDAWVKQLGFRKANPRAIGKLSSPNTGPFTVDGLQAVELVYTLGDQAMEVGGGFVVDVAAYGQALNFQTDDPAGEGYTTVVSSNPELRLAVEAVPIVTAAGTAPVPRPFFRIAEGRLRAGDTVSIRIGEQSKGGPGLRLPSVSTNALRFAVWVRLDAKSPTFPLQEVAFATEGQTTAAVRGFAPSVVAVGDTARVAIRSEDVFRNRATSGFPVYVVTANGAEIGRVRNTNVAVNTIMTTFQTPGAYHISIASEDGKLRGEANPILVEAAPSRRVLWGDVDGHTRAGRGQGTLDAWYAFARDEARLDFAAVSDSDSVLDDAEWEAARLAVQKYRRVGEFEPFLAHAWNGEPGAGGARVIVFRTPENRRRADRGRAASLPQLYALLAAEHQPKDVLAIALGHRPADWWHADARFDQLAQVYSVRGGFDWLARRYQQAGLQIGVSGGSADEHGHPGLRALNALAAGEDAPGGLTAVIAPARTRDAIFDALKRGATYATNGARIVLDVAVNGAGMGQRAPAALRRQLVGRVLAAAPIERIVILKNGQEIQVQDFARAPSAAAATALELRFASDSDPQAKATMARGFRSWRGTLRIDGAKLKDARANTIDNWYTERVGVNSSNPQLIDFELRTRGNERSIIATFEGAFGGARLGLDVRSRVPDGNVADANMAAQADAFQQTVAVAALAGGEQVLRRAIGANIDTLTVRLIKPPVERERSFEFVDAAGSDGDFYSVRVHTMDGGVAWSSPVWVGGRAGLAPKLVASAPATAAPTPTPAPPAPAAR